VVVNVDDTANMTHALFCRGALILPIHFAFQCHPAVLDHRSDPMVWKPDVPTDDIERAPGNFVVFVAPC
jgi:hypothetical protein